MKILVAVFGTSLVLALTVNGYDLRDDLASLDHQEERETRTAKSKYTASSSSKLAAQICKPFFAACRENAAGDKKQVGKCFMKFLKGCMQKIRKQMDGLEQCVSNAGSDFSQVQECISPSITY